MGFRKFKNNASSRLASGIAAGDTVLTVTTGEGALFPSLGTGDYFYATLESGTAIEIVKVTARATDTFTIARAQEGTSAQSFSSGSTVELRLTAKEAEAILFPEKLAKSGAYTAVAADHGQLLAATGTWTLALTAAATLADGWALFVRNVSTGVITVDPDGAETIDGVSSIKLYPNENCLIMCDGSAFFTLRETERRNVLAKTATYTVVAADHGKVIDATSGTWDLVLTAAATLKDGFWFALRNTGSGTVTINPDGSETIDGAATLAVIQNETAIVVCDGSNFKTIARYTASSVSAASQAEQETGSSLTVFVSPGRQQYHPSAAKAWVQAGTTGNAVTSYNVSSVTDTGVGDATINLTTQFSSANYCAFGTMSAGAAYFGHINSIAQGSFRIQVRDTSGTLIDPSFFMGAAYGDQ